MKEILGEGRHLRLVKEGRWEFAERTSATGATCIVAVTEDQKLLLVEQFRASMRQNVVELPAGLAGDSEHDHGEMLATAAQRELLEETGYEAGQIGFLTEGPVTPGLTNEVISFFKATHLRKVNPGGGDDTENITVHEVPLSEIDCWLEAKAQAGLAIDPKIYAGLYFCRIAT